LSSLPAAIVAILADVSLDDDADPRDSSRARELEKLSLGFGWQPLEAEMLRLLASSPHEDHWQVAAAFFWSAVLDRRPADADRLIAHLCLRFSSGDNLAWSITSKLKGVSYLSEYDPLQDPGVLDELEVLRGH
jgi:hypothetical protein